MQAGREHARGVGDVSRVVETGSLRRADGAAAQEVAPQAAHHLQAVLLYGGPGRRLPRELQALREEVSGEEGARLDRGGEGKGVGWMDRGRRERGEAGDLEIPDDPFLLFVCLFVEGGWIPKILSLSLPSLSRLSLSPLSPPPPLPPSLREGVRRSSTQ